MRSRFHQLLGRYIIVYPVFIDIAGDASAGIFLSTLYFWSNDPNLREDGWIRKSKEIIYEDTRLGRKGVDRARGILKKAGILEESRVGVHGILHLRLNIPLLDSMIESHIEQPMTDKEQCPKWTKSSVQSGQSTVSKVDTTIEEEYLRRSNLNKDPSLYSPQWGEGELAADHPQSEYGEERGRTPTPPKRKDKKKVEESEAFQAFYSAYPRKQARPNAWKAWQKQGCEDVAAEIMDVLPRHPALDRDSEFIPLPATWLNQRRWEDEIDTSRDDKFFEQQALIRKMREERKARENAR